MFRTHAMILATSSPERTIGRVLGRWPYGIDLPHDPIPLAGNGVKESQGAKRLVELAPRRVKLIDHPKLEVPDLLGPEFLGVFAVSGSESVDVIGVGFDGSRREVPELHVLGHALGEGSDTLFIRGHT
jgi:hypothetical protein